MQRARRARRVRKVWRVQRVQRVRSVVQGEESAGRGAAQTLGAGRAAVPGGAKPERVGRCGEEWGRRRRLRAQQEAWRPGGEERERWAGWQWGEERAQQRGYDEGYDGGYDGGISGLQRRLRRVAAGCSGLGAPAG